MEEQQKKRPSCLGILTAIGALLGAFLAIITGLSNLVGLLLQLPKHFVVQISGFQISIGITVFIALLILLLMGFSFTLGMLYMLFGLGALLTKKKPPRIFSPFATLAYPFLRLANWISERRYEAFREKHPHPPSELQKRLLARLQEQKEKKSDSSSSDR